jgi:hypothetical protein
MLDSEALNLPPTRSLFLSPPVSSCPSRTSHLQLDEQHMSYSKQSNQEYRCFPATDIYELFLLFNHMLAKTSEAFGPSLVLLGIE